MLKLLFYLSGILLLGTSFQQNWKIVLPFFLIFFIFLLLYPSMSTFDYVYAISVFSIGIVLLFYGTHRLKKKLKEKVKMIDVPVARVVAEKVPLASVVPEKMHLEHHPLALRSEFRGDPYVMPDIT